MAVETLGSVPRARVAPWNDPIVRGWVFQIVVVGLVGLLAWYLVSNTMENLARQKIASGFHYLEREAGFEIGDSMIAYSPADTYARAILVGLLNTLKVAVLGIILATILGTLIGVGRLSPNWLLAKICDGYVEMFRNVPILVWLLGGAPHHMSWPTLQGFNFEGGTVIQPEFTALLVGLVLYTSAFVAEIVRSGILALHKGQTEAAMAIGLSRGQVMRLVLLPQALRIIVPPMTSQYLNITKNSSLAIAIGYPDLVAAVNVTINQTGQAIANIRIIMAAYLSVILSISAFINWYNKRIALTER